MSLLSEILSSKVRADIFRILFGLVDEPLHMREIERRSGYAIGTIQAELRKLVRLDLVKRRRDGNRVYYEANKDHPLYPDIRSLVLKTIGLIDVIRDALKTERKIQVAFVFGSVARYAERAASDVDLMVVGGTGLRELSSLLVGVSDQIGREVNPHVFTVEEFVQRRKNKDHFVTRVLEGPKLFIVGTEDELAAMGG